MKKIWLLGLVVLLALMWSVRVSAEEASSTLSVVNFSPSDGESGVSIGVKPTITFSAPLNPSTLSTTNIELREYQNAEAGVDTTLTLSGSDTTVIFTPVAPLKYNQQYYFFVGTGLKDVGGNWLPAQTWYHGQRANHEFTTEAAPIVPPDATSTPPEATSTVPAEPTATSTAAEKDTPRYDTSGSYRRSGGRSKSVSLATPKVLGAVTFVASDVPTLGLFATNLGLGSVGAMVLMLQERLVGENLYHGALDSHFGPQLAVAVRAYQLAHELPVTGFVGVLTRAALNAE